MLIIIVILIITTTIIFILKNNINKDTDDEDFAIFKVECKTMTFYQTLQSVFRSSSKSRKGST